MTRPAASAGPGRVGRFLLVSVVAHALAAAILWAELRPTPAPPEERPVALVWDNQRDGAGDPEDSAGGGAPLAAPATPPAPPAPEAVAAPAPPAPAAPEAPPQAPMPAPMLAGAAPPLPEAPAPVPPPALPLQVAALPPPALPRHVATLPPPPPPAAPPAAPPAPAPPAPAPTATPSPPARQAAAAPRPAPARPPAPPAPPAEAPTVWRPPGSPGLAEQGMAQSAGPGIVTGAVVQPRPRAGVSNPSPDYPRGSRLRGEQGRVTLLVQVGMDGRVTEAAVLGSSGHEALDRAAEAAVRRWQFEPATQQGRPVFSTTTVNIMFRLEQDAATGRR